MSNEPEDVVVEPHPAETLGMQLQKTLKVLVIATAVLYMVMVGLIVKVYLANRSTHDALCTYRNDLVTRVIAGNKFIAEHPNGVAGFTVKELAQSVNNQQHTILALKGLNCSEQP